MTIRIRRIRVDLTLANLVAPMFEEINERSLVTFLHTWGDVSPYNSCYPKPCDAFSEAVTNGLLVATSWH